MSRYRLQDDLTVEDAVMHCDYFMDWDGKDFQRAMSVRVLGVAVEVIARRFIGGDGIALQAEDYDLSEDKIEQALRWQLLPRDTRRRRVLKAIKGKPL